MNRLIAILFLSCFWSISGFSQENEEFESNVPKLNRHHFISNTLVNGPFTNTSFSQNLGIGFSAPIESPTVNIGGVEVTLRQTTLIYANLFFRYNQRIKDWVSFYIRLGGAARVGTDPGTLLTQGVNTMIGTRMGWKIRLFQTEKHMLSVRLGVNDIGANFINVLGYVQDVIDSVPNPNISDDISVLQGEMYLDYAYEISPIFGIQANGKVSFGDSYIPGESTTEFGIGVALDANLYPRTRVPLGLSLGLAYASLPELSLNDEQESLFYSLKLAFSGAENMLLSLDATGFRTDIGYGNQNTNFSSKVSVYSFTLNMVYFFN